MSKSIPRETAINLPPLTNTARHGEVKTMDTGEVNTSKLVDSILGVGREGGEELVGSILVRLCTCEQ